MFISRTFLLVLATALANTEEPVIVSKCDQEPTCHKSLTEAVASFTESLYADIARTTTQDNFVFSPLSIHSALALLYAGSTSNTSTNSELRTALGSTTSPAILNSQYKHLIESLATQHSFLYANSIWAQKGFNIDRNFSAEVKEYFDAETNIIDFTKETSVDEINSWVSNRTKGLIEKLVQRFSSSTSMFLANALYFKDRWLVPFQERNETDHPLDSQPFHGESVVRVPMMLTSNVHIGVGNLNLGSHNATFLTIPYISDQFEMQIILPDTTDGKGLAILEDFVKANTNRDKQNHQNIFLSPKEVFNDVEDVRLMMPKFSVSTKFEASDYLRSLGVRQIFQEAELEKFGGGSPVAVSSVLHKAVLTVDKEGTVGAAATGVELVLLSGSFGRNIDVNVDRPFIFIVQDKKNNIPILVGRIKNPLE